MPGKIARSAPQPPFGLPAGAGSRPRLAYLLRQGRKNANIYASSEVIWGIPVHIDADDGQLPNAVSTPVALILNELLTNAAKYGGNKRGVSEIAVLFKRCGGEFILVVEDDGPGFELHETGRRSTGLGLVGGLARQLCGRFDVVRGSGARCIVRFPELTFLTRNRH